ncbi:Oidioi.mRNA.OKI2018_I69.chr1.g3607.t1.cds [Oikopleura dioica]|uniref:Oidioi.mRNA.OKI2018_I69.chr1.g3607.t1.cds n=1 Tax=Oikopleura dioica TaxID=34765 RepID=A0ABN7T162_OIKDI|nr:Oidioi.mRNA.OKI2018_I69.chr1.g3607.t1.cds [Oikopleura dioica]
MSAAEVSGTEAKNCDKGQPVVVNVQQVMNVQQPVRACNQVQQPASFQEATCAQKVNTIFVLIFFLLVGSFILFGFVKFFRDVVMADASD